MDGVKLYIPSFFPDLQSPIQKYLPRLFDEIANGGVCIECDVEYEDHYLITKWGSLYTKGHYSRLNRIAEKLSEIMEEKRPIPLDLTILQTLNEGQKRAVSIFFASGSLFLTGGPGTGKTFTVATICKGLLATTSSQSEILALAPTGKAVSRLEELLSEFGIKPKTIHRAIQEAKEIGGEFYQNYIIIDECSMIDLTLFDELIQAIPKGAHVLFVGDPHQLPPVTSYALFGEIITAIQNWKGELVCTLTETVRTDRHELLSFFESLRKGVVDWPSGDRDCLRYTEMIPPMPTLPENQTPEGYLEYYAQFRYLSPIKEGEMSVKHINNRCSIEMKRKGALAEPIIITQNGYGIGLYNGDTGIVFFHENTPCAYFETANGIRSVPLPLLPPHEKAYALSIHKSQGSEFAHVMLLLPKKGSERFGKEALYTAATRAKKKLTIIGKKETVEEMLCRKGEAIRFSQFMKKKEETR